MWCVWMNLRMPHRIRQKWMQSVTQKPCNCCPIEHYTSTTYYTYIATRSGFAMIYASWSLRETAATGIRKRLMAVTCVCHFHFSNFLNWKKLFALIVGAVDRLNLLHTVRFVKLYSWDNRVAMTYSYRVCYMYTNYIWTCLHECAMCNVQCALCTCSSPQNGNSMIYADHVSVGELFALMSSSRRTRASLQSVSHVYIFVSIFPYLPFCVETSVSVFFSFIFLFFIFILFEMCMPNAMWQSLYSSLHKLLSLCVVCKCLMQV